MKLDLPDAAVTAYPRDEWIIVLGGAGSVGQYTVQVSRRMNTCDETGYD
jgi:NADPH:quinone reductase-like Zn-dependent oxidoreductase